MIRSIGIVYLIASVSLAPRPGRPFPRLVIYKIGKSHLGRRRKRLAEIDASAPRSKEYMLIFAPAPARWMERALHSLFKPWRYTYTGSGKREYFWPSLPFALRAAAGILPLYMLGAQAEIAALSFIACLALPDLLFLIPAFAAFLAAWAISLILALALPCAVAMLLIPLL